MCQVHELKEDYQLRETHKPMVAYDNFDHATANRETGKPERGYGSVLPRYQLQFGKRHLNTTHRVDFQYPFDWTPKPEEVVINHYILRLISILLIMLLLMQHVCFFVFFVDLQVAKDEGPEVKYRHGLSELTDTADHRRKGLNTWQDSPGSIRDYNST